MNGKINQFEYLIQFKWVSGWGVFWETYSFCLSIFAIVYNLIYEWFDFLVLNNFQEEEKRNID